MYTELNLGFLVKAKKTGRKIVDDGQEADEYFFPENFEEKSLKLLQDFQSKYAKFRHDSGKEINYCQYIFSDKKVVFEEIFNLLDIMHDSIDLSIHITRQYEDEDFKKASAFILAFPKECYYYDEWPDGKKYHSLINHCGYCHNLVDDFVEQTYIKPDSGVSKMLTDKMSGATTSKLESIVSIPLHQTLLEGGIDNDYFRPVRTKSEKVIGYKLYGGENVLPPLGVSDRSMLLRTHCPKCSKVVFHPDINDETEMPPLVKRFGDLTTGNYPLIDDVITITSDSLSKLKPVNLTNEYFFSARYIVIDKQLFNLIAEAVPRVKRFSMPIFQSDELWDYIDWELDPRIYDDTTGEWVMPE